MKEKESKHKNSLNGIIGTLKEPETIRTIGEVVVMLKGMKIISRILTVFLYYLFVLIHGHKI